MQDGYAVIVVCDGLDYPHSTYYHTAQRAVDDELRGAIRLVVFIFEDTKAFRQHLLVRKRGAL